MSRNRLLRRVAELEAQRDPPQPTLCLLAWPGDDGVPRLRPEDEARRGEAEAAGRDVVIIELRVQQAAEPDADPFAEAPRMAQERPEGSAGSDAAPAPVPPASAQAESRRVWDDGTVPRFTSPGASPEQRGPAITPEWNPYA